MNIPMEYGKMRIYQWNRKKRGVNMGVWIGALGRITVSPEPDDDLIREYIKFSNNTCPKGYSPDEIFNY